MKKSDWKLKAALICLGMGLLGVGARADIGDRHSGGHVQGGGGDGVPSPFVNTNRFVDLADGEAYTLVGRIVFRANQAYFNIDLEKQPWLATVRTRANPYFQLNGDIARFYSFEDDKVRMIVRAHGEVVPLSPAASPSAGAAALSSAPQYRYEITLTPATQSSIEVLH